MTFLSIIFIPPLYFLSRKKWGGFITNSFFYGIACLCVLSIVGIAVSPLPWAIAMCHAAFAYRKEASAQHADMVATKLAEKLQQNNPPSVPRS